MGWQLALDRAFVAACTAPGDVRAHPYEVGALLVADLRGVVRQYAAPRPYAEFLPR